MHIEPPIESDMEMISKYNILTTNLGYNRIFGFISNKGHEVNNIKFINYQFGFNEFRWGKVFANGTRISNIYLFFSVINHL